VGCFAYSPVEGAAANELPDPVPEEVKAERLERFMELQSRISADRLQAKVGRTLTVLVDGRDEDGVVIARSAADAPEIDGVVVIEDGDGLEAGQFVEVEVMGASDHDVFGVRREA
jgi:ribosomal protein S12 methylthiotransferase